LIDDGRFEEAERELTRLYAGDAKPIAEYGFARLAARKDAPKEAARRLENVLDLGVSHPERVLNDDAFRAHWSDPDMAKVRARLLEASRKTGTSTTARDDAP
jgi:hypothetical protein